MKTKEYLEKYGLQNGENARFDKQGLLKDLYKELICNLESYGDKLTYPIFNQCVKQISQKFWAISNKRKGLPFTPGYWNVYYMEYTLKARERFFPEIHKEIENKRKLNPQS